MNFSHWFGGKDDRRRARAARLHKAWWETAAEFHAPLNNNFDPLGSYTGRPNDGGEPEQDADDL